MGINDFLHNISSIFHAEYNSTCIAQTVGIQIIVPLCVDFYNLTNFAKDINWDTIDL